MFEVVRSVGAKKLPSRVSVFGCVYQITEHAALCVGTEQEAGGRAWLPCVDVPESRCTFEMRVTTQLDHVAVASGKPAPHPHFGSETLVNHDTSS